MALRLVAFGLTVVRMTLKSELKMILREKIVKALGNAQDFIIPERLRALRAGKRVSPAFASCKQSTAGVVPASLRSILGINAYAGYTFCIIVSIEGAHSVLLLLREKNKIFASDGVVR